MKIYDCFTFFNEIELLEIRLNILNDVVDYFVISEAELTHSYKYKGLIIPTLKNILTPFKDKIRYIKVNKENFVENDSWHNENLQRNCLKVGLMDIQDDDIVILSDLDEIPNPITLKSVIKNKKIPCTLTTDLFYGYLNTVVENFSYRKNNGPIILNKKDISVEENIFRGEKLQYFRDKKDSYTNIPDGGWHFSFCVGDNAEKAITKISSFAHQEFNNDSILSNVENNLKENKDILSRGSHFNRVIDNSILPTYILDNKEKYKHLMK